MTSGQRPLVTGVMTLAAMAVCVFDSATTSTILLLPFPSYSHVNPMLTLGEILAERGQDVHVLLPSLYGQLAQVKAGSKVKVMEYQVKAWEWNAAMHAGNVDADTDYFDYVTQTSQLADVRAKYSGYHLLCRALLSTKILDRQRRRGLTFDLGIVDSHPLTRCHYVLMYKYDIPYASYSQLHDPWLSWSPALPSYVPTFLAEKLTDKMSFWQRLVNAWTVLYWYLGDNLPAQDRHFVGEYVPGKPAVGVHELAVRSRLWLSYANFFLDYPRPVVSNEILVGWALMRDARQLPPDHPSLEGSNRTRDGIIVLSLDENIALPARVVGAILTGLKAFHSYHVVWQYGGDLSEEVVPRNVRVLPYVPLNDLVGHPRTRLLVTSADSHHQNMALYHGVPVLCLPLQPVQRHNARKTEYRRHGIVVYPEQFAVKTLVQSIRKLVSNDTYYRNVEQASRIMKMKRPLSQQSMVQWLQLSLATDFEVLRPHAVRMPWASYAMLDIALLVAIVFGNAAFLLANSSLLGLRRLYDVFRNRRLRTGQPDKLVKPVLPSSAVTPITKSPGNQLTPTTPGASSKPPLPSKPFKQQ